ncbi:hypothetical protein Tco_0267772 [Tanacetum coccineum]
MVPPNNLGPDLAGKPVNETPYRGMIRSLMYLIATRPDIQFSIVICARYQSNLQESHLIDVKRILRCLSNTWWKIGLLECQEIAVSGYVLDEQLLLLLVVVVKYHMDEKVNSITMTSITRCTAVTYDPFPPADETKQRPLREFLIKFSVLNGQRPLTLDFKTFCSSTGLDYNNGKYIDHPTPKAVKKELGKNSIIRVTWTKPSLKKPLSYRGAWRIFDENFRFLPGILSNSNFTKDPSKVTDIELTAYMIDVNSQKDSVSPLPLAAKPKKGKSQTVTLTLPKSQGTKIPRALSKKSKRPNSKRPSIETM